MTAAGPEQQHYYHHHSMLGFSFPSAGASSVMSLQGDTFRQLQLQGLYQQQASLLMTSCPGGWLLQVRLFFGSSRSTPGMLDVGCAVQVKGLGTHTHRGILH